ncbi:MAG: protein-glutamate O-methyltransferase CheR [Chitinivibrionales bacterium]|nr:protein-glutamate O-methyltransferase CheR [Chitinivibrionales bacterium]
MQNKSNTINELAGISNYIEKECGIVISKDKTYLIETRLTTLMVESGCQNFIEFHQKALQDQSGQIREKIIDAMTNNETLWFRDTHPFTILNEVIFEQYAKELISGGRNKIRIWSAACSTGQEPYSIAIAALEYGCKKPFLNKESIEIVATDISQTVLFLAMSGRFNSFAMSRGMSDALKNKYFTQSGNIWSIDNSLRKMVSFKKLNLQNSFQNFEPFDVIFLRNVMIYFSDSFKKDILSRIGNVLRPAGYLFLGGSEFVKNYTDAFTAQQHKGHFYFMFKK